NAIAAIARETPSLYLLENKGQVTDQYLKPRPDIDFSIAGGGMNLFIGPGKMHFQFNEIKHPAVTSSDIVLEREKLLSFQVESYRIDVELLGANINAGYLTEHGQSYYENYFLAHCPKGIMAHTFTGVTYRNVYP